MNTQQLDCFLRVADKLNFTKAAKELYLSTPTVTHHIQSLEAELNTKLFIRNTKSVRLSEAGIVFYNDAIDLMSKFDLAKKHAATMNQKKALIIRIGCSSNSELDCITTTLTAFKKIYTEIYPRIIMSNYSQLMAMLQDKQLDIVFGTKDMMSNITGYTFKSIKKLVNYAVFPLNHQLSKKDKVSFDDLQTICLITLHPKLVPFKFGSKIQAAIHHHSKHKMNIICENDQSSIALVSAGYGVAILPEFCIPKTTNAKIEKVLLIESEESEYGIAYQTKGRDEAITRFVQLCQAALTDQDEQ